MAERKRLIAMGEYMDADINAGSVPEQLKTFFTEHTRAALAYSGGADSAYLLYAGVACGADIKPYYVKSQFQPRFELKDALETAKMLNIGVTVIERDILAVRNVAENPENRCYYCKNAILDAIFNEMSKDGYTELLDGTNASDDETDRPGAKALSERSVISPLKLCGVTKPVLRELSRQAGLPTWDKPAYACLATRIPHGERVNREKLAAVEECEDFLFSLSFTDFRVRVAGETALIQLPETQMGALLARREDVYNKLNGYFGRVMLDLLPR